MVFPARLKVLVVEPTGGDLGRLLTASGQVDVLSVAGPDRTGVAPDWPSAIVLDADFLGETLAAVSETLRRRGISGEIIAVASVAGYEVMRRAMSAGVHEFLTRPIEQAELVQAIRRVARAQAPAATLAPPATVAPPVQQPAGKVVAVFSPRGGAGCTTVVANLSAALGTIAMRTGTRVAVVDGRPEFGAVGVALSLDAEKKIVQWPAGTGGDLEGLLVEHWSGLQILLPPSQRSLSPDQLPSAVLALRARFGFVVVDLGHDLDAGTEAVLQLADNVILVTTTDIAALVQVGRVLDRLTRQGLVERTSLVVNRADERPSISPAEVERRLGQRVSVALPVDGALRDGLDLGVPLVLRDPAGKIAQRFLDLAAVVAGPLTAATVLADVATRRVQTPWEVAQLAARRRELYGLGVALVAGTLLGGAALLYGIGALNGTPLSAIAAVPPSAAARPGIGTPVRDRYWEYTVVSLETVEPDARYFTRRPAGRFLAVNLRLQNVSSQNGILGQRDVRLRDDRGGEYDVSSEGGLGYYLRSRLTNPFATPIAPGLTVNTAFVFDVPDQNRSFILRVQGAPLAEPVEIALSR
ncbi:MAG: DUF4352 domain-containing protein [Chloroflexi bacterium]|nr:DUF4352 domain-containing protein [Chloroflexota bacterium]